MQMFDFRQLQLLNLLADYIETIWFSNFREINFVLCRCRRILNRKYLSRNAKYVLTTKKKCHMVILKHVTNVAQKTRKRLQMCATKKTHL